MKKRLLIPFFFLCITAFISCNDDDDNNSVNVPTEEEFNLLRDDALEDRIQTAQFDAGTGINFTSDNGCILTINPNCLTNNSVPVTGMVDLEYVELFERSDMLVTNKSTMGRMTNGDLAIMESGGAFYIQVSQNDVPLDASCIFNIQIPASLTGGSEVDMSLWEGTINEDGFLEWDEEEDQGEDVFLDGNTYFANIGDFGWTNVDRFYNDPSPKTTILVDVPDGYDADNCAIYLLYDDLPDALAHLDTYDSGTGLFSEHYGQVPIGLECHVIFVSEQDGSWLYGVKDETVEEDEIITFTNNELQTTTEEGLVAIIEALD